MHDAFIVSPFVLLNSYSAMNTELWNKILAFDFDSPPGEYSFSIRMANENYWTTNFTKQAILEYKKFMYLAATSEFMVSPSEIIGDGTRTKAGKQNI